MLDSVVDSTASVAAVVVTSAVEWVEAVCKADSVVLWVIGVAEGVIGVVEEVVVWVVTAADSEAWEVAWEVVWVEVWEAWAADSVVWEVALVADGADLEAVDSEDLVRTDADLEAVDSEVWAADSEV